MTNNKSENKGNFWVGFFIGGLVGAFIIFVLGTKEGKKLADRLQEATKQYEEDLEEKIAKLQKQGEKLLNEAQEIKQKVVKNLDDGKKNISEAVVSKLDKTLTNIEDIQKKGVALTEEVHRRYFKKNGKPLTS